jgi:hypothetical protein
VTFVGVVRAMRVRADQKQQHLVEEVAELRGQLTDAKDALSAEETVRMEKETELADMAQQIHTAQRRGHLAAKIVLHESWEAEFAPSSTSARRESVTNAAAKSPAAASAKTPGLTTKSTGPTTAKPTGSTAVKSAAATPKSPASPRMRGTSILEHRAPPVPTKPSSAAKQPATPAKRAPPAKPAPSARLGAPRKKLASPPKPGAETSTPKSPTGPPKGHSMYMPNAGAKLDAGATPKSPRAPPPPPPAAA